MTSCYLVCRKQEAPWCSYGRCWKERCFHGLQNPNSRRPKRGVSINGHQKAYIKQRNTHSRILLSTHRHTYTYTHICFLLAGKLVHRYPPLSPLSRSMQTQVFSMVIKQTPIQVVLEAGRGCVPPASPLFLGRWLVQRRLTALWSWRFCLTFLFLAKWNDHGPDRQLLISGFLGEHTFTARVHPLF